MRIKSFGYLGLAVEKPLEWLNFATQIVGAMPARAIPGEAWALAGQDLPPSTQSNGKGISADGSVYIKIDDWQWRVAAHPVQGRPGVKYIGLEVHDQLQLEIVAAELEAAGFPARFGTLEEARARSVREILHASDPAGNPLEFFYGPTMDFNFVSPQANTQFVAGKYGVGHINLFVKDMKACFDFYTRVLGFQLSDYIRFGEGASVQFLRCNARHHSIALVEGAGVDGPHHLLFEVPDIDGVGRALDRALKHNTPITSTLGRHINDNMLSFYMQSPLGFDVEIGCEGSMVDDDWTAREFCEGDIWGHHGLTADAIQAAAKSLAEEK